MRQIKRDFLRWSGWLMAGVWVFLAIFSYAQQIYIQRKLKIVTQQNNVLEKRLQALQAKKEEEGRAVKTYLQWQYIVGEQTKELVDFLEKEVGKLDSSTEQNKQFKAMLWYSVGMVRLANRDFLGAQSAFELTMRNAPNFAPVYYNLGLLAYFYGRNLQRAREFCQRYLQLAPQGRYAQQAKEMLILLEKERK